MKSKIFLFTTIFFLLFSSCTKRSSESSSVSSSGKKSITVLCTSFSEYDWCREILGFGKTVGGEEVSGVELSLLMDKGSDLHNYQPTVSDIVKIQNADVLLFTGGESDAWIKDALKSSKNKDAVLVNLMETLGERVKIEDELFESDECESDDEGEIEYDEHIWLSVKNAVFLVGKISGILMETAESRGLYESEKISANTAIYIEELKNLDKKFADYYSVLYGEKVILVGDRFPFRYFCDDYGITYFAAFPGCSAESEASFQTIVFLADKIRELKIPVVYILENSDGKIAKSIIQNSGSDVKIEKLNSLQSVTKKDIDGGATYLSLMEENFKVLAE